MDGNTPQGKCPVFHAGDRVEAVHELRHAETDGHGDAQDGGDNAQHVNNVAQEAVHQLAEQRRQRGADGQRHVARRALLAGHERVAFQLRRREPEHG